MASLALNLLLAFACLIDSSRSTKISGHVVDEASASGQNAKIVEKNWMATVVVAATPARVFDWRTVDSKDYREYIANLRKIDCPERTIRDVIVADVNDLYRERYREIFPPATRIEYWKPGNPLANLFDGDMIATQRELEVDKRDLIKTLLGAPYSDEDDSSAIQLDSYSERLLNFLTPDKRTAMKELEDTFAVKMLKTYKDTWRGNEEPANAVQAEKDEAMLMVLTPEEKFEYDLRRSDTAVLLRVGLKDFELNEAEFRAVFPAIKDFLADAGKPGFGAMMLGQQDPRPEGAAARAVLQAQLKAALGNERYQAMMDGTGWDLSTEDSPSP